MIARMWKEVLKVIFGLINYIYIILEWVDGQMKLDWNTILFRWDFSCVKFKKYDSVNLKLQVKYIYFLTIWEVWYEKQQSIRYDKCFDCFMNDLFLKTSFIDCFLEVLTERDSFFMTILKIILLDFRCTLYLAQKFGLLKR